MQKRKIVSAACVLLGVLLFGISAYLFFRSNKTIYSSDKTTISDPQTSISNTLLLEKTGNPYQTSMRVTFNVTKSQSISNRPIFSYIATLLNSKGDVIEQKSSSYTYAPIDKDNIKIGEKSELLTLFTLRNLPTDKYSVSITVKPEKEKDPAIQLQTFSYQIKSNLLSIHPAFPIAGLVLIVLSYVLFPKKSRKNIAEDNHPQKTE